MARRGQGDVRGWIVGGVAAAGLVAWATAPWVSMCLRGTIDAQAAAGWRRECAVPAPRRAPDDEPSRSRSA